MELVKKDIALPTKALLDSHAGKAEAMTQRAMNETMMPTSPTDTHPIFTIGKEWGHGKKRTPHWK